MGKNKAMGIREAVIQVLREAGEPLHAQEITERILTQGLWQTSGKTPAATVSARLYSDIKKHGDASVFKSVAAQTFCLRDQCMGVMDEKPTVTKAADEPEKKHPEEKPPEKEEIKTHSFTDAAEKVLDQFGNKRPMHYRAITEKALSMGWLATEGKTPEATMYAQILTEIKRYRKTGEQPRFAKHGRGYVGLTRWMGRGIAFEVEQHNKQVRQALHKRLLGMDPVEFEEFISLLLAEIGFEDYNGLRNSDSELSDTGGRIQLY